MYSHTSPLVKEYLGAGCTVSLTRHCLSHALCLSHCDCLSHAQWETLWLSLLCTVFFTCDCVSHAQCLSHVTVSHMHCVSHTVTVSNMHSERHCASSSIRDCLSRAHWNWMHSVSLMHIGCTVSLTCDCLSHAQCLSHVTSRDSTRRCTCHSQR